MRCRLTQLSRTIPSKRANFHNAARNYAEAKDAKKAAEIPSDSHVPSPGIHEPSKPTEPGEQLISKKPSDSSESSIPSKPPNPSKPSKAKSKGIRKISKKVGATRAPRRVLSTANERRRGRKRPVVVRKIPARGLPEKVDRPPPPHRSIEETGLSIEKSLLKSRKKTQKGPTTVFDPGELKLDVIDVQRPPVPRLAHGLSRVLFNPGVAHVRDPRSRVLNFDPHLEKLMPVREFDFNTLAIFTPPSKDQTLATIARESKKKYIASTSSMTGVLKHFHFLLSCWRGINFTMLSKAFPAGLQSFTKMTRCPDAIFLKWKKGVYAVDADKMYDGANVLSLMGRYMEKLLTLDKKSFERHRVGSEDQVTEAERKEPEAFHYSTLGDFILRSQLDAYDARLPGTGMFDLKTRAVVPIRMDSGDFEWGMGYEIRSLRGEWQSFEREYHDMIRSTMLKYSLQVRMGRMDGIFVAFHNIARIFGFQYVSLDEMDNALHGQWDRTLGDQEFLASVSLMNDVFNRATEKFPEQTIRFHFETREATDPFMYIFAEPVTDEQAESIQTTNRDKIREWEKSILGTDIEEKPERDINSTAFISPSAASSTKSSTDVAAEPGPTNLELAAKNVEQDETSEILPEVSAPLGSDALVGAAEKSNKPADQTASNVDATKVTGFSKIISEHAASLEAKSETSEPQPLEAGKPPTTSASGVAEPEPNFPPPEPIPDTSLAGDTSLLSSIKPDTPPPGPLFGTILSIRSTVNNAHVLRPSNPFTTSDKWDIHYTLANIDTPARCWSLFNACKARRHKEMSEEARQKSYDNDYFKNMLRRITEEGRVWREGLEEEERVEREKGGGVRGKRTSFEE